MAPVDFISLWREGLGSLGDQELLELGEGILVQRGTFSSQC